MGLKRLNFYIKTSLVLVCGCLTQSAWAQLSVSMTGGYGVATQFYEELNAESRESPASVILSFDFLKLPSRSLRMGVVHARSLQLSPFSSGLAYTLGTLRTYMIGMPTEPVAHTGPLSFKMNGICAYLLTGAGLSQGFAGVSTSFGGAIVLGLGMDWSFGNSFFWRTEASYYKSIFISSNTMISATSGIGFVF